MLSIYKFLFGMAILFVPFIGSLRGVGLLGGMGTHLSFYPLFIALVIMIINVVVTVSKITIPANRSFWCLLFFLLWMLTSSIINIPNLFSVEFKGISGINRNIAQIGTFFIYIGFSIMIFNLIKKIKYPISFLEKYLLYSFAISGVYSLLELFLIIDFNHASEFLSIANIFRGDAAETLKVGRIRSVASEASFFGMYASMILPWLIVRWFDTDKSKIFSGSVIIYFFLLVLLSFSRAAYFSVAVELVLIFILFHKEVRTHFVFYIFYIFRDAVDN